MPEKHELRQLVRDNLAPIIAKVNSALRGDDLEALDSVLTRLGRGGQLPHWYQGLKTTQSLPNLDGKTIGSVIEMILVAVLETNTFAALGLPALKINPARGVDLPDLDLGVKSPSENYCTSEPFFSAYERLLGSEHDAVVLLTDYQDAKKKPPLRLQITSWRYLVKTQVADESLCRLARKQREWLLAKDQNWAMKICRFLAFVNQSDWRAKKLLKLIDHIQDDTQIAGILTASETDFKLKNAQKAKQDKPLIPDAEIESLQRIATITPRLLLVISE